jgi:hypothetical protein
LARTRQVALAFALGLCSACDVVQGFEHAGDALFPPVETYLDVPGYRMTAGHFRYLDMVTTSEPFILARSATDGDDTLFVMHFHSPTPCSIPNVASYWTDGSPDTKRTYLAYFDPTDSGVLHFSDLDCTPLDFTLDNANLPIGFSTTGLVIQVGTDLFDIDPVTQSTNLLASSIQGLDVTHHLVLADGRIGVFDDHWAFVRWIGDGVVAWQSAFGATFYEDKGGIERLTLADSNGIRTASTVTLATDACHLTILPTTPHLDLVGFHAPCADQKPAVWDAQTHQGAALDWDVDLHHVKFFGTSPDDHPNLATDPYFAVYLAAFDSATNTGELHARLLDHTDLVLGSGAALERADLSTATGHGTYSGGFALLDVSGETGRFVRFDFDGNVSDVATSVIRSPAESAWTRLVVATSDELADLEEIVDGQAVTVAHDVPRRRYAYLNRYEGNPLAGRLAWFHDVSGDVGTLSLAAPDPKSQVLDDQGHEALYRATPIERGVFAQGHGFMYDLPGFVYYTHWDAESATGRLSYSNVELGFSATVSDGVSDYLQPGSGLLYAVPFGAGAGIWLARGK